MNCYCQSSIPFNQCCEPLHQGQSAPTAEKLMRSRYSAYVLNNANYLYKSWSLTTRPTKQSLKQAEANQWVSLEIINTSEGSLFDSEGIVEFKASYRVGKKIETLHEVSHFVKESERWVYLDGKY